MGNSFFFRNSHTLLLSELDNGELGENCLSSISYDVLHQKFLTNSLKDSFKILEKCDFSTISSQKTSYMKSIYKVVYINTSNIGILIELSLHKKARIYPALYHLMKYMDILSHNAAFVAYKGVEELANIQNSLTLGLKYDGYIMSSLYDIYIQRKSLGNLYKELEMIYIILPLFEGLIAYKSDIQGYMSLSMSNIVLLYVKEKITYKILDFELLEDRGKGIYYDICDIGFELLGVPSNISYDIGVKGLLYRAMNGDIYIEELVEGFKSLLVGWDGYMDESAYFSYIKDEESMKLTKTYIEYFERRGENYIALSYIKEYIERLKKRHCSLKEEVYWMNRMIHIYRKTGQYKKATAMGFRLLETSRKINGEESIETASIMSNISVILEESGKLEKAYELAKEAYEIARLYDNNSLKTLKILNNLSELYWKLGYKEISLTYMWEIIKKKKLYHPKELASLMISMNNMALSLNEYTNQYIIPLDVQTADTPTVDIQTLDIQTIDIENIAIQNTDTKNSYLQKEYIAKEYLEEVLEFRMKNPLLAQNFLCITYNNLACIEMGMGYTEKSQQHIRQSTTLLQESPGVLGCDSELIKANSRIILEK